MTQNIVCSVILITLPFAIVKMHSSALGNETARSFLAVTVQQYRRPFSRLVIVAEVVVEVTGGGVGIPSETQVSE